MSEAVPPEVPMAPAKVSVPAPFFTKWMLRRWPDPLWARSEPEKVVSAAWSSSMPRSESGAPTPQSARIEPVP